MATSASATSVPRGDFHPLAQKILPAKEFMYFKDFACTEDFACKRIHLLHADCLQRLVGKIHTKKTFVTFPSFSTLSSSCT